MTNKQNDPSLNDRAIDQLFDGAEADARSLGAAIGSVAETMRHDTNALLSSGVPMLNPHKREWDVIKENAPAYQPDPDEFDVAVKPPHSAKRFNVGSSSDLPL